MKAAVLVSDMNIEYKDFPLKTMGKKDVKIRIKACGICGSDVPRVLNGGAHFYPIVLGHEFSGVVEEKGSCVNAVQVGDHVAGIPLVPCMDCEACKEGNYALCGKYSFIGSREAGGFSDYVVLPEKNVIKINKNIDFSISAMLEPITVAIHAFLHVEFKKNSTVAILGAGTIGIFAIQWAKILGAVNTVAFDISDERLELAKESGADFVVNTNNKDFIKDTLNSLKIRGFDYVFECAGNTATMKYSFELAGNHSKVCFIGTPKKDLTFSPNEWEKLNRKEFFLTGSFMSYSSPFPGVEWSMSANALSRGEIKVSEKLFYKTFPMSEADKAFKLFDNPSTVNGKVMLVN